MTFHDFFLVLFKFSKTLGLVILLSKIFRISLVLGYFLVITSSKDTNSGVHQMLTAIVVMLLFVFVVLFNSRVSIP